MPLYPGVTNDVTSVTKVDNACCLASCWCSLYTVKVLEKGIKDAKI